MAGNYLLLAAGESVAKLTLFLAFTHIGRTLGAVRYGGLEFALASMVFFTLPVDLGLGVYGAREVARNPAGAPEMLGDIIRGRMLLFCVSLVGLFVYVLAVPKPLEIKQLLLLYGLSLLALPFHLQWYFQGHDRMHWVALASIIRSTVFAALAVLLLRGDSPLTAIGLIECAAVAAVAGFCLVVVRWRFRSFPPARSRPWRRSLTHLRTAAPIGFVELTWAFLWYITTVLLGLLVADESLGWFGASHRIVMALHTFVWMYFFNLLPSISRTLSGPRDRLAALLDRSIRLTAWGGYAVALAISVLSTFLLTTVYGREFTPGGPLLATMVWIIPIALLSGHYRFTLIAYNLQHWHLYATAMAAALVILLTLLAVPRLGAQGAARALLVGCALELVLVYFCVRRFVVRARFLRPHAWPALAVAGSLGLFHLLAEWPIVWRAAVATMLYLSAGTLLERKEIHRLTRAALERVRL